MLRFEKAELRLMKEQVDLDRESLEVERKMKNLGLDPHRGSTRDSRVREEHFDTRNLSKIVPLYKTGMTSTSGLLHWRGL